MASTDQKTVISPQPGSAAGRDKAADSSASASTDTQDTQDTQDTEVSRPLSALQPPTKSDTETETSAALEHPFQKGEKLVDIVAERYGLHAVTDFSSVYRRDCFVALVAAFNGLDSARRVKPGTKIRLPELKEMFLKTGLPKTEMTYVEDILEIESLYYSVDAEIYPILVRGTTKGLSDKARRTLTSVADSLDEALNGLEKDAAQNKPKKAMVHLRYIPRTLRAMLEYPPDGEPSTIPAYSYMTVRRRFDFGIEALYRWAVNYQKTAEIEQGTP